MVDTILDNHSLEWPSLTKGCSGWSTRNRPEEGRVREDAEGGWKEGRAGLGNQKVGRRQLRGHFRA